MIYCNDENSVITADEAMKLSVRNSSTITINNLTSDTFNWVNYQGLISSPYYQLEAEHKMFNWFKI